MKTQYDLGFESGTQYFIENLPNLIQESTQSIALSKEQLDKVHEIVNSSDNKEYYQGFMDAILIAIDVFNSEMKGPMSPPIV